ncbi:MAG: hypothetical protein WCE63_23295 [Acidobacteriaceae bacterium]
MTTDIERRIQELELRVDANAVAVLHLAGGIVHRIAGSPRHFFALAEAATAFVVAARAGEPIPETSLNQELTWIRDAWRIDGPGYLFEMLQVQLLGPTPRGEINPE